MVDNSTIRLNKYLADKGIASRRKADELIAKGLVKLNGVTVTELGTKVNPATDKIEINDQILLNEQKKHLYIKMNKPYGYECTKKPERGVPSIYDLMPESYNVFSIGRLDKDSEGLLLLTNDGRLAYKLTHPKFEKEKEYEVTVDRQISDADLKRLADGILILGKQTSPTTVERISQRKFMIILKEGMNRQIRRMCRKVGYRVHKLKRLRVGIIELDGLQSGKFSLLTGKELSFVVKLANEAKDLLV
jgi:23S rRNA pseudouridine2605 synthase/23S rRNA pseudouridine2604 synthase